MDPELYYPDNVFWAWKARIVTFIPDVYIRTIVALLLLLLLGLAVKRVYVLGGPAAIIAVAMGFLAGLSTPTDLAIGFAMLLLAFLSAYISGWGWRAPEKPQG
jgi:hypothetical protein